MSPENVGDDVDEVLGAQTSRARKTRILGDESDMALDGGDNDFPDNRDCAVSDPINESKILRSRKVCLDDNNASSLITKSSSNEILETILVENSSDEEFVVPKKIKKKYTKKSKAKQK